MRSRIVICLRQIAFVPNAGQAMLVPAAENDRIRVFRRGSVVDPCGRVDTRPYKALRRRARGYAPLQGAASAGAWIRAPTRGWRLFGGRVDTRPCEALRFGTLAQLISILPQGDRQFSILPFQFSIQQQDGGLGSGRPTGRLRSETLLCPFWTNQIHICLVRDQGPGIRDQGHSGA